MSKITYENKETLYSDTSIADKNKVTATDMNEIKKVVNDNADELDNDIIALQKENERLRNDLNNSALIVTGEGENITLNGTAEARFKEFGIGGNSKQETSDTMPSPSSLSEIKNVEGNFNITICNANLINPEDIYDIMYNFSTNVSEATIDGKECLKFSNISYRPDKSTPFNLLDYNFREKKSYTIRGLFKRYDTDAGRLFIQVVYTDRTTNEIGSDSSGVNWQELKLVTDATKTIAEIGFSYAKAGFWYLDKNSMFIAESDTTNYTEHQEQKFTFPFEEGQKLMLGDYLADDGIHHKKKQIVLDGTENWSKSSTVNRYYIQLNEGKEPTSGGVDILCSHYLRTTDITSEGIFLNNSNYNSSAKYLVIIDNSKTTLEEWKSWLSEQKANGTPVTAEFDLAEEEIEAYTEEQQKIYNEIKNTVKSYGEVTHIFSSDEISPIFNVAALQNLNLVISKLQTSSASEENS